MLRMLIVVLGLALLVPTSASADIKAFCDLQREKLAPYFKTLADNHRYNLLRGRKTKAFKKCFAIPDRKKGQKNYKLYDACMGRAIEVSKATEKFTLNYSPVNNLDAAIEAEKELRLGENSILYGAYCKKF